MQVLLMEFVYAKLSVISYKNNDMNDLEEKLKEAKANNAKHLLIATDGVFSMDGFIANLKGICDLSG